MACPCTAPATCAHGDNLLVASALAHTRSAVVEAVQAAGARARQRGPVVEVDLAGEPADRVLSALAAALSGPELEEARVLDALDERDDPVAAALLAPTLAEAAARTAEPELAALLRAERSAFSSAYQPIVRLGDGAVVGHEALLRARGPAGPIPPDRLFAAAARANWLAALDRIGRETALRGARGWLGHDLLFVNFIPTTIYRPEVCLRTTERAMADAGLRFGQVVFEVTEGERVRDVGHLEHVLDHYRARGCKVALDDLGAGYSTLNLLVRLRPDVVKIDREIVQALPGATARTLIGAVVDIAASMGTTVLVEGVETPAQAEAARDLGVDLAQGFLFGHPVPRHAPGAAPAA